MDLGMAAALVAPGTLFFVLGAIGGFVRSDLTVPEQVSRGLALYLMLCIGFKGGVEARLHGFEAGMLTAGAAGLLLSFATPLALFPLLRTLGRLDSPTAAAAAAAYGSVSVVTFAAASEFLTGLGRPAAGYMAAVLAVMETPAILTGLLLARRTPGSAPAATPGRTLHEVFCNGALMVLVGSFVIGALTGAAGMARLDTFVNAIFQGALCFFLLDMGLTASRSLLGGKALHPRLVGLGILIPLTGAALALGIGVALNLPLAEATMLMVLAGSASYIAVPAAMRLALPEANAGVYVTLPLAVTFPFNLLVGIPLYAWAASRLLS
ncbi:MAG: sodium-dependent bicarbonate transport family permease [Phenylobacterium sp.]|uniref:sodium-dependent bicarbonate transport family permease n=1 Tax=Phenylobacterium sp. TaxID=1871053 RepID=UPI001A541A71|nr:sodium-dependent bicarbonate transport family permease [Phenylobacterium sp.]MBL8771499.1 sodium-dependent bicarbonate transport family permease [Phenylobacterium sp.]